MTTRIWAGSNMTGTFSCYVDGSSGHLYDFNITVGPAGANQGDYQAKIEGASGFFNSSSFEVSEGAFLLTKYHYSML